MTAHWEELVVAADVARRQAGQLWTQALATRCPFVLALASTGKPLGYGDDYRCDKDVHTGDDHQLSDTAWTKPEVS